MRDEKWYRSGHFVEIKLQVSLGTEGVIPLILNLALDGGDWSVSRPGYFTLRETTSGNNWEGGRVGSRTGLDALEKCIDAIHCNHRILGRCSFTGMITDGQ